ncbi:hypothetical protein A3Q56_08789, partial [Intoshia linei]
MDLDSAQNFFAISRDYASLMFINRVRNTDTIIGKALIHHYFGQHEAADAEYNRIDRKDLVYQYSKKLGLYGKLQKFIRSKHSTLSDSEYNEALLLIGDYLFYKKQ